jgi:hypothetical protein
MRGCHRCAQEFTECYGIQIHCENCILHFRQRDGEVKSLDLELLDSLSAKEIARIIRGNKFYASPPVQDI